MMIFAYGYDLKANEELMAVTTKVGLQNEA